MPDRLDRETIRAAAATDEGARYVEAGIRSLARERDAYRAALQELLCRRHRNDPADTTYCGRWECAHVRETLKAAGQPDARIGDPVGAENPLPNGHCTACGAGLIDPHSPGCPNRDDARPPHCTCDWRPGLFHAADCRRVVSGASFAPVVTTCGPGNRCEACTAAGAV